MIIWIRRINKHTTDVYGKGNTNLTAWGNVSLRTDTKTLVSTTALFQIKHFILYHTLIKSTAETHTATLIGPHRAYGDNGIFSTLQLALTCWVVNRLQAIILSIQDNVHAESSNRNTGDKSSLPLLV